MFVSRYVYRLHDLPDVHEIMFGFDIEGLIEEMRTANRTYAELLGVVNERLDKVNQNLEKLIELEEKNLERLQEGVPTYRTKRR